MPILVILIGTLVLLPAALYRQPPGIIAIALGLHAGLSYPFLLGPARYLLILYPILAIAWFVCRWRGVSRPLFAVPATTFVLATWGLTFGPFVPKWFEIQRLAAAYPQVEIASRLSYERRPGVTVPGSIPEQRDKELRFAIHTQFADRYWSLFALEELHDDFFEAFAAQDGFGDDRMTFDPPEIELPAEPGPLSIPFRLPPATSASTETPGPLELDVGVTFHREQILNFTNANGFGFPVDGKYALEDVPYERTPQVYMLRGVTRVRGFQPHAFQRLPEGSPAGNHWQLARLELVSLLKHDQPAVYVSKHLPRMQELSQIDAPTRSLDAFETASLNRLQDGQQIVAEQSHNRLRMLGGVRAAIQCTQCHNVGEGQLLGAFSYEFLRKVRLPPKEEEAPQSPVI